VKRKEWKMAWIRIDGAGEAGGALREAYDRVRQARGKLSNIMAVQSLDPGAMMAHLDLYMALMFARSGLSREEREAVAVVVSALNGCAYCVEHHAEALRVYWRDTDRVRELAAGKAEAAASPRLRAILGYAVALTLEPRSVTREHVEALRAAGLSDAEILNANMVTAYFGFVNRVVEGLGVESSPDEAVGYHY
jgi:uncharacterized peroxidase-related enzyme